MTNWFMDKEMIVNQTVNSVMEELEWLTENTDGKQTANYWIDNTHNVFAFVNDNGDGDVWIEIHFELHNSDDIIGDLTVVETEDLSYENLFKAIVEIVNIYYGI